MGFTKFCVLICFIVVVLHLRSTFAIINGVEAGPILGNLTKSIGIIDNFNVFNALNDTLEYCTATLLSPLFLITQANCCNEDIWDQRVKLGSPNSWNGGMAFPANKFRKIIAPRGNRFMGICIVRTKYPTGLPHMRLPAARLDLYLRSAVFYAGYGTRMQNSTFDRTSLNCGPRMPTTDISLCMKDPRYAALGNAIKNEICVEVQDGTHAVMGLYDNGGPLIHLQSRTIVGIGMVYYTDYLTILQRPSNFQLFLNIIPLRSQILQAMEELDLEGY